MSQKLIPQHPEDVMVIRNVTPNIVTLSVPFSRGGLFKVGGRGTIGLLQPYIEHHAHDTNQPQSSLPPAP
jgi:hypothetical protein